MVSLSQGARLPLDEEGGFGRVGRGVGLLVGIGGAAVLLALGPQGGLGWPGWITLALMWIMVTFWITEAVPPAAAALLPLIVFPATGIMKAAPAAAPYAEPVIFVFIGGFMIAKAIERWNLHARAALTIASKVGARPSLIVTGFILGAGAISLWISNTSTALMFAPIAVGVAKAMADAGYDDPKFGTALVLGVAYAASVGGMGTPVGSPTNLIAMGFLTEAGEPLSFARWSALALPIVCVLLPFLAWMLTRGLPKANAGDAAIGRKVLDDALRALGPMSKPEARVLAVFLLVAAAWMTRELLVKVPGLSGITDMGIAIAGAFLLFLLPSGSAQSPRLLDWRTAESIPWGIVILFGGGLSLAKGLEVTGVAAWIGDSLSFLQAYPPWLIVGVLVLVTLVATELMSNVATLTAMLPVVAAFAKAAEIDPLLLVFPVSLAASLGYMLPTATAPNAVAYGTGLAPMGRMLSAGLKLNLAGALAITAMAAVMGGLLVG